MTVAPHNSGTDLANFEDMDTGLEDFDAADAAVPRLTIVHKKGLFRDSASGDEFETLNCIILGLVKQRVLWHTEVDDGDMPMCKSSDHQTGYPNDNDEQPKAKRFPWDKSGFDPKDFPINKGLGWAELPCESCDLKEWKSHPDGKRPYCSEQFTLSIMYDPNGDGIFVPAIISFQKTGIKPTKTYLGGFARAKRAAFTVMTTITLDQLTRGQTDYCVPIFKKGEETDSDTWRAHSANGKSIREFLHQPPRPPKGFETDEDGEAEVAAEPEEKPAKKAETKKAPPKDEPEEKEPEEARPEPVAEPTSSTESEDTGSAEDEDDLPF